MCICVINTVDGCLQVTYYGDCSSDSQQIDAGVLTDYRQLLDQGQRVGSDLSLRVLSESLE